MDTFLKLLRAWRLHICIFKLMRSWSVLAQTGTLCQCSSKGFAIRHQWPSILGADLTTNRVSMSGKLAGVQCGQGDESTLSICYTFFNKPSACLYNQRIINKCSERLLVILKIYPFQTKGRYNVNLACLNLSLTNTCYSSTWRYGVNTSLVISSGCEFQYFQATKLLCRQFVEFEMIKWINYSLFLKINLNSAEISKHDTLLKCIDYSCSWQCLTLRARILVQVTIHRRLLIGRDGRLDQSKAYDVS